MVGCLILLIRAQGFSDRLIFLLYRLMILWKLISILVINVVILWLLLALGRKQRVCMGRSIVIVNTWLKIIVFWRLCITFDLHLKLQIKALTSGKRRRSRDNRCGPNLLNIIGISRIHTWLKRASASHGLNWLICLLTLLAGIIAPSLNLRPKVEFHPLKIYTVSCISILISGSSSWFCARLIASLICSFFNARLLLFTQMYLIAFKNYFTSFYFRCAYFLICYRWNSRVLLAQSLIGCCRCSCWRIPTQHLLLFIKGVLKVLNLRIWGSGCQLGDFWVFRSLWSDIFLKWREHIWILGWGERGGRCILLLW